MLQKLFPVLSADNKGKIYNQFNSINFSNLIDAFHQYILKVYIVGSTA